MKSEEPVKRAKIELINPSMNLKEAMERCEAAREAESKLSERERLERKFAEALGGIMLDIIKKLPTDWTSTRGWAYTYKEDSSSPNSDNPAFHVLVSAGFIEIRIPYCLYTDRTPVKQGFIEYTGLSLQDVINFIIENAQAPDPSEIGFYGGDPMFNANCRLIASDYEKTVLNLYYERYGGSNLCDAIDEIAESGKTKKVLGKIKKREWVKEIIEVNHDSFSANASDENEEISTSETQPVPACENGIRLDPQQIDEEYIQADEAVKLFGGKSKKSTFYNRVKAGLIQKRETETGTQYMKSSVLECKCKNP